MPLLLLAVSLALSSPARTVDTSWGVLTRSDHLRGHWQITLDDGTHLKGDWIVVNREPYLTRDFGGGGGPAKAIHLIDSKSERACAFDADQPLYLYCTGRAGGDNTRVAAGAKLALPTGTTSLDTYQCDAGNACGLRRGGTLELEVARVTPTLAEEEMLFERTTGRSLADWLGATTRHDRGALVLVVPVRTPTVRPAATATARDRHYTQDILEAEATIRIGPALAKVSISARETARYVEDCFDMGNAMGSCSYMPPVCRRRN